MTELPDADDVARFLEAYPDFFERNPALITGLRLTTALGGRTVSLQERQVELLRDKARQLELKLAALTRNANSNDDILGNLHQWILRLLSDHEEDTPAAVLQSMRESFALPAASLRLWNLLPEHEDAWFAGTDANAIEFADKHATPVCGPASGCPGIVWLDDAPSMQSAALLPLRRRAGEPSFGLMVLGSPDPQRFSNELATDILARIAELASVRLQHLIA